jgi:hypothetical protein
VTEETAEALAERVMQILRPQLEQAAATLMRPYLADVRAELKNLIAETREQVRELTELVKAARDEADRITAHGREPPRRPQ